MVTAKDYLQTVFEKVEKTNSHQKEFLQAVQEFFQTIEPVIEKNPHYI